jgi:hypothetical protein
MDEQLKSQIKLFPNPNDGQFTVTYPEEMAFEIARVIDGLGRVIHESKPSIGRIDVDLGQSPNGMYRLELVGENGFISLPISIQK